MTKREKELLERIDALEKRIQWLEARPVAFPVPYYIPAYVPQVVPVNPWPTYPTTPYWITWGGNAVQATYTAAGAGGFTTTTVGYIDA